jgi:hypothetical protein
MNQRIQELAEQAGYDMDMQQHQKFAELIVRECANIALREDHDPYECILAHFGIKL